jgi:hypothetical protein
MAFDNIDRLAAGTDGREAMFASYSVGVDDENAFVARFGRKGALSRTVRAGDND